MDQVKNVEKMSEFNDTEMSRAEIISASRKPRPPRLRNPALSAGADAARWRPRRPSGAKGSSLHEDRGQNARVVVLVSVEVVVAVALDRAIAEGEESQSVPRDN